LQELSLQGQEQSSHHQKVLRVLQGQHQVLLEQSSHHRRVLWVLQGQQALEMLHHQRGLQGQSVLHPQGQSALHWELSLTQGQQAQLLHLHHWQFRRLGGNENSAGNAHTGFPLPSETISRVLLELLR
jgi:hypothetical protein